MSEFFESVIGILTLKILSIITILLACTIAIRVLKRLTKKAIMRSKTTGDKRLGTVVTLLQSTLKYVIYFIGFALIMGKLGVNIAPIIASAGVVGVAVAFGAQSLVRDVISGLFIMIEDAYSVGDYIKVAGVAGFVTELGLRTTKLRDWTNETHIVPNGNIAIISNYSRDNLTCFLDIPVSYAENGNIVLGILQQAIDKLNIELKNLTPNVRILGINSFEDNRILFKLCFTAAVNDQLFIERAIRLACKNALDQANIMMPACYSLFTEQDKAAMQ